MNRTLSCFIFLLLLSCSAQAGIKPFPGYYINKNGDSVQCNIEFSDWRKNPKTITVWSGNNLIKLGPADIKAFGVYGYVDYISATVTYHTNPISGSDLPEEFSDAIDTNTCFLKNLANGQFALYELWNGNRPYYFVCANGTISELVYRVKEKEGTLYQDRSYRDTLQHLFSKAHLLDQYARIIFELAYSAAEITTMIDRLNNVNLPQTVNTTRRKSKVLEIDLYAGAVSNNFPTSFDARYTAPNKLYGSFSSATGLNILWYLPGQFKTFAIGISVGYGSYQGKLTKSGANTDSQSVNYHQTTVYTERFFAKNTVIQTNLYLQYYLNPLQRTQIYFKGGAGIFNSVVNKKDLYNHYREKTTGIINGVYPIDFASETEESVIDVNNVYINFFAGIGLKNGRHKLEAVYYSPAQLSAVVASFKLSMFGFYYYYTLIK